MTQQLELLKELAYARYRAACVEGDYQKEKKYEEIYNHLTWACTLLEGGE